MNGCIFCKIAAGQIKADVVYTNQQVMAFRDVSPKAPVHILIIPKKHIERLSTISEADFGLVGEIHRVAQWVAKNEKVEESGYRFVTNNGEDAGQSVQHLHYHLLGGRVFNWPPG
ncbi:MAG: Purine nucleoside phosphoramidase [Elusimicrobia bacterium]|nr:Purine nucleoside phosphoramidase [Elusimicrobiota bacterium]